MESEAGPVRRWERGETVMLRHVWRRQVLYAMPMFVVEEDAYRSILYLPVGTLNKRTFIDFEAGTMTGPTDHVMGRNNILQITPYDAGHSVWAMWSARSGRFLCWYVNLQRPARRVADGLVSWDQTLDIVVGPDFRWAWKDEEDFRRAQELGWMSTEEASSVREEGLKVIGDVEARRRPFDEPWQTWQPDPGWTIPQLQDGWDKVPAHH